MYVKLNRLKVHVIAYYQGINTVESRLIFKGIDEASSLVPEEAAIQAVKEFWDYAWDNTSAGYLHPKYFDEIYHKTFKKDLEDG